MAPADQIGKTTWMLASIAVVVAALYLAKGVLVPLTLAVLLSFLLSPVCDWFERHKLSRIPAVFVTAILGFAVLGAVAWTAVAQMSELGPNVPAYQHNLETKLHSAGAYAMAALSRATKTAQGIGQNLTPHEQTEQPQGTNERPFSVRVLSSPANPLQLIGGTFGTAVEVLGSTGIVLVLVVFFLIRREDLRDRFIRLIGKGHVTLTTQAIEDAATRVSRYLLMQFIINVVFGIAVTIGLYFIGVPNAVLWGILAAILRFIPYIGGWISAAMPIGLSLAISLNWVAPILTVALFVVLELFTNNVIEPWLYGKNTGVSAVAVLLAAIFWTWLWGAVGLLLATPLTVCLLVIGKHVPQLSFLDTMLGNEPVFEPKTRVYQRLLAGDPEEAAELVEDDLEHRPLVEVYDSVLIPALALAETHWRRGELDEDRHRLILQSLKELIEETGLRQVESQTEAPPEADAETSVTDKNGATSDGAATVAANSPPVCILCLPARDEADEIAAIMLSQLLDLSGCEVQALSVTARASEMIDLVVQHQPAVVCISATPPAAVMHARYLCLRLRARMPQLTLIVGLWDTAGDLTKAKKRIGGGARTFVVATLAEADAQVRACVQPLLPEPHYQAEPENEAKVMEVARQ